MILYSMKELLLLAAAAIAIDWFVGDPKWPTHPVIWIGRLIRLLERLLAPERLTGRPAAVKALGIILTAVTLAIKLGIDVVDRLGSGCPAHVAWLCG